MPDRVIIRGGLVVDGSGGEPYEADIAVRDGAHCGDRPRS